MAKESRYLRRRENGYWYAGVRSADGKVRWDSLRTKNKSEALVRYNDGNAILNMAAEAAENNKKAPLLSDLQSIIKNHIKNTVSDNTFKVYSDTLKLFLKIGTERFPNMHKQLCRMDEVTTQNIEDFKKIRQQEGVSASTINSHIRCLKTIWTKCIKLGYINNSPLTGVSSLRQVKINKAHLTKDELQTLIDATPKQIYKDLWTFASYTGLRLGEIVNLQFADLDFTAGTITVQNSKEFVTKTGKSRILTMLPNVRELLERQPHSPLNDLVFTTPKGAKFPYTTIQSELVRALERAKLSKKISFHSFRHTFATWCAEGGVDMNNLKLLMGHSTTKMLENIYLHISDTKLKKEMEKILS